MKNLQRILIVEDNPDDESLLMRQLRKAEMDQHVRVIRDGGKAVKFLTDPGNGCEDLIAIFLDLQLPTLTGLQILETIRADERLRHLPVIVLTSSNSPEQLQKCRNLGVTSFVKKPVTLFTFEKAVADMFHAPMPAPYSLPLLSGTYD